MKPAFDPVTLARAVELTVGLEHAWPDQCHSVPTLALAIASSAPELAATDLMTLGELAAWLCAFHESLDGVPATYVDQRIARYQALVCRAAASSLAGDRAASMLIDVLVALRAAPLGGSLWPLFSTQLAATLEGRHGGAASYIGTLTTAAAMLIGEPMAANVSSLLAAQRHAAIVLRLAREHDVERLMSERLDVAKSLAKLAAAPATASFVLRFTDFFVALGSEPRLDLRALAREAL